MNELSEVCVSCDTDNKFKNKLDITRRHKMGFLNITMDQIDPRDCISLKSNGYTSHGVATGYNVNKIL